MTIEAKKIVSDTFSPIYGKKLGEEIIKSIVLGDFVIDFKGVDTFTSLFFNAMFNVLIKDYEKEEALNILRKINVKNLSESDNATFNRSKDTVITKLEKVNGN